MKNYYRKDEQKLSIKNLEINDNKIIKIGYEEEVVRKDVLYYDNLFNAIIRFEDDHQTLTREEAYDEIQRQIYRSKNPEELIGTSEILFIDTAYRNPIALSKEDLTALKKEKKLNKQKIKSLKKEKRNRVK